MTESPDPPGAWQRPLGVAGAVAWVLALGTLAAFAAKVLALAPEHRVGYVPDDGYYYLLLARHFGETGRWTFDGGVSETSGFHVLFAYVLVPVGRLANALSVEFDTLGVLTSVVLTAAAWCVPIALAGRHRAVAAVGGAAVFVAWSSIGNAVAIVEWPLVVAIDGTLAVLLLRDADGARPVRLGCFVLLGLAGSLARTDFGLWPVALAAAAYLVRRLTGGAAPVRAALAASVGAVAGVVAASAHHAVLSGSFVQSSVLVKSHWVSVAGGDFRRPVYLLESLTAPLAKPLEGPFAAAALLAAGAALALFIRRGGSLRTCAGPGPATLAVGSVLSLVGYVLVYSRNGDVQPWYSAHLVVPVASIFACGTALCVASGVRSLALASVVATLALAGARAADSLRRPPTWPHQADMMMAGALLRDEHRDGRAAAWNAGVLSYHQGGTVVNLDGLVNNDAARAVVAGRLEDYLVSARITHIADFATMVADPALRARGGYAPAFTRIRLDPQVVFDDVLNRDWSGMTIYRVVPVDSPAPTSPPRRIHREPGAGEPLRWGFLLAPPR